MFSVIVRQAFVVVEARELGKGRCGSVCAVRKEGRSLCRVNVARECVRRLNHKPATKAFADVQYCGVIPGIAVAAFEFDCRKSRVATRCTYRVKRRPVCAYLRNGRI